MTTAVDTNIVVGLWNPDPALNVIVQKALDKAQGLGAVVASGPVFAELMAAPGRTETFLNHFFENTGIRIEFDLATRWPRLPSVCDQAEETT